MSPSLAEGGFRFWQISQHSATQRQDKASTKGKPIDAKLRGDDEPVRLASGRPGVYNILTP
jgi:hypothetical protein